jgi:hypothetical protein
MMFASNCSRVFLALQISTEEFAIRLQNLRWHMSLQWRQWEISLAPWMVVLMVDGWVHWLVALLEDWWVQTSDYQLDNHDGHSMVPEM